MRKNGQDNRPNLKPVTKIEVSEERKPLRIVLAVGFFAIGIVAIVVGLMSLLNTEPGWQQVQISTKGASCAGEFVLMYDFSDAGAAATAVNKELTTLYSQAAEDAYRIFSADLREEGLKNVRYLNDHVNEAVTVEPALYKALSLLVKYGSRYAYLAPAYAEYDRVFLAESDAEAARYHPSNDPELSDYLAEIAGFAANPEQVNLELQGDNQVRLSVSREYRQFAEENGIETLLDFGWMKNAFIADFLADTLEAGGFTSGYLSSYDGFTRNLDRRGNEYTFNLFDRQGNDVNLPARMKYDGPMSVVFLRDYPMSEQDRWHYYAFENGEIVTAFLDTADGLSKSACPNLVSYSKDLGCGEILMQTAPVFIADGFQADSLDALAKKGVYSFWSEGAELKWNDPVLKLEFPGNPE
ncbi:MAG: hypothetical protein ACI3V5_03530 [Faecousia sp.]